MFTIIGWKATPCKLADKRTNSAIAQRYKSSSQFSFRSCSICSAVVSSWNKAPSESSGWSLGRNGYCTCSWELHVLMAMGISLLQSAVKETITAITVIREVNPWTMKKPSMLRTLRDTQSCSSSFHSCAIYHINESSFAPTDVMSWWIARTDVRCSHWKK